MPLAIARGMQCLDSKGSNLNDLRAVLYVSRADPRAVATAGPLRTRPKSLN